MFSIFTKKERTWDFMHKEYKKILKSIEHGTSSKEVRLRISDKNDCKKLFQALRKDKTIERLNLDNFESLKEDDSDYEEFEGIGASGTKELAEILTNNNTLKDLDLSYNNIKDQGAISFGLALRTNTTLTDLDVRGNNITIKGIDELSKGLKDNVTLSHLDLGNNNINPEGAQILSKNLMDNLSLSWLILSGNKIGDKGCKFIANLIELHLKLYHLDLSDNQIGNDGVVEIARSLPKSNKKELTYLNLSKNTIGPKGFQMLAANLYIINKRDEKIVYDLILDQTQIKANEIKILLETDAISSLSLSNNQIRNADAKVFMEGLAGNENLKELDLSENQIDDDGVQFIFGHCLNLRSVDISNNQIGDRGLEYISNILAKDDKISSLHLGNNKFTDDGAKFLVKALSTNTTLKSINFTGYNIKYGLMMDNNISNALKKEIEDLVSRNWERNKSSEQANNENGLLANASELTEKFERSKIILQEAFRKEKKMLEEYFLTTPNDSILKTLSLKLENLQKNIDELYHFLKFDPIGRDEQDKIDNYSDSRLKIYQDRLGRELVRFMTCYFLAPAGVFQFSQNKKDVAISAIGSLPIGGILLTPLTCILSYASKKYRFFKINNIGELFNDPAEIIQVCSAFSRKMTLARINTIVNQNEVDGVKKIYEEFKDVVELQLKDLPASDLTGVNLNSADRLAIFDAAFLLKELLSGDEKLVKDKDLVFQFLNIMKKFGISEIHFNQFETTLPLSNNINKPTYLVGQDSRLELMEKHIQRLHSKMQYLEKKEGKDKDVSTNSEKHTSKSTFVNKNVVPAESGPLKNHESNFIPHFSSTEFATRGHSATICLGKDVMKNPKASNHKKII